jgi:general L-amino acid transport system substrate-binding protein
LAGFAEPSSSGSYTGFDADFCRAVAAAVFGDADAVEFVPLTAAERFPAVAFGDVDVLFRISTHTFSRDAELRMDFGPTTFYDGQRLMGLRTYPFTEDSTIEDIDGAVVCAPPQSAAEENVANAASNVGIAVNFEPVDSLAEAIDKLQQGRCDIVTSDTSGLAGSRASVGADDDWAIFPSQAMSREPLSPVYQSDDSWWGDVVDWVVYATILAESKGISSTNLTPPLGDVEAARLLGVEASYAEQLGLNGDAFLQVIKQVGNYGEIYDRNLTPLGLTREGTLNDLAENGGLLYAPPFR